MDEAMEQETVVVTVAATVVATFGGESWSRASSRWRRWRRWQRGWHYGGEGKERRRRRSVSP